MNEKTVNLAEIARIANVNPSTVSRALHGSPLVKESTRELIQEIAQKYGYIPDGVAQSLSRGKTATLGIIVPEISNSFYAQIVDTIEQGMVQYGYSAIIYGSRFDPETELRGIRTMLGKRVDALIVCDPSAQAEEQLLALRNRMPVIVSDAMAKDMALDCVYVDERKGILAAAQHLKEKGHREVGCIADGPGRRRMNLIAEILEECGFSVNRKYFYDSDDIGGQCGYDGMYALARRGELPTALFAARDSIAIGAMRAAVELQIKVPEQLGMIGYDDISMSNYLYKKLTTIHQPASAIGQNVVEILLRKLQGEEDAQKITKKRLIPELVVREST